MRAVVQRVSEARVVIEGETVGSIGRGLVVLLGVAPGDDDSDIAYLAEKVANLRIFEDYGGRMNLSVLDVGGEALVVSQFTLHGDCRRGRRPSFTGAAHPEMAGEVYGEFVKRLAGLGLHVETGRFGAMMTVEIHNDGPVTILLDSERLF